MKENYKVIHCNSKNNLLIVRSLVDHWQNSFWSFDEIKKSIESSQSTLIALTSSQNQAVGLIFFNLNIDFSEVLYIYIAKEFRGLGLGKMILNHYLQYAKDKKLSYSILEVDSTNKPAIIFYIKMGYMLNRTRKNYYSNGNDAYEMLLNLP